MPSGSSHTHAVSSYARLQEIPLMTQEFKVLEVEVIFMLFVMITECFIQAVRQIAFLTIQEQCINHLIPPYMKKGNYERGSKHWRESSPGAASVLERAR